MCGKIKIFSLLILFIINANNIYSLDNKIKARHLKNKADSLAKTIDSKSKLLFVISDSVDIEGTSNYWIYCYISVDSSKYYYFHTDINSVILDSISHEVIVGPRWISKNWIDSDSAMFLAELKGGKEFRTLNPHYRITAILSEGLVPISPPEWCITYISNDNPNIKKFIIIDATLLTSVQNSKNNIKSLENYLLYQNFPNPFNPTTTIQFYLAPTAELVNYKFIRIYNLLGQLVSVIDISHLNTGTHALKFNGMDFNGNPLPSGMYLCQLVVGSEVSTIRINLVK